MDSAYQGRRGIERPRPEALVLRGVTAQVLVDMSATRWREGIQAERAAEGRCKNCGANLWPRGVMVRPCPRTYSSADLYAGNCPGGESA